MFQNPLSQNRSTRRAQRGQSIVVALLVLLLLGLAGALFVTIVARNVLNAAHASRVLTADQYAHAGITFADSQLSNSLDGADWRPPLVYQLSDGTNGTIDNRPPVGSRERARYTAIAPTLKDLTTAPYNQDPDLKYLQAGFTRFNTGAGRFLLRVTYDPVNIGLPTTTGAGQKPVPVAVPPGKYLKIESIGREGIIDNIDPTTYGNNRSSDRTQAYQVAYKPIGITDYARFETNPDKRSETANLGVTSRANASDTDGGITTPGAYDFNTTGNPPTLQQYAILTTYGAADAYLKDATNHFYPNPTAGSNQGSAPTGFTLSEGGGSIHANMPVRFFGKNIVYLNNAGINAPLFQDSVEIAGDLLLNGYNQANPLTSLQAASLEINPADLAKLTTATVPGTATTSPQNQFVVPSNDTGVAPSNGGFNTLVGLVRDGAMSSDAYGLPRGIQRLEPPLMDALDTASQLPRYKALTMNSAPRHDPNGSGANGAPYAANSGQYGYGQAIYINNSSDIQENSKSIGGGSTLVDQWLNKTSAPFDANKGGWNGDFYQPPGVNITLGRQNLDPATHKPALISSYGIRMTLSSGRWPQPDGTAGTTATQTVMYDDLKASNDPAAVPTATSSNLDNDIVIYAEGNVRVHGIVSADPKDPDTTVTTQDKYPRHITIVTNGTAYIEGNLLKGNPDSSITVLAHDYVCVNTTQFLAGPQSDDNSLGTPPAVSLSGQLTFGSDESRLIQEFSFGLPNSGTASSAYGGVPLGLYISGGSEYDSGGTTAEIEIVNPATGLTVSGAAPFSQANGGPNPIAFDFGGLSPGVTYLNGQYTANAPLPNRQYFALPVPLPDMSLTPNVNFDSLVESDVRLLYLRRSDTSPQNLNLERIAILPADIRIEAVLYAQTGSFFVIPGPWFNSSSSDTLDTFISSFSATLPNGIRVPDADTHFPFYGQPIDLKITIDGSVSEAQPADVSAQTSWMLKWGWIPQYHGFTSVSSTETAGHTLPPNAKPLKPAVGLQIIYNPQAGYPYNPLTSSTLPPIGPHYLRSDIYGRPLPFTPKLPVSTALLFAGESTEPPLLQ